MRSTPLIPLYQGSLLLASIPIYKGRSFLRLYSYEMHTKCGDAKQAGCGLAKCTRSVGMRTVLQTVCLVFMALGLVSRIMKIGGVQKG
jgi:uncharacterized membrane protein